MQFWGIFDGLSSLHDFLIFLSPFQEIVPNYTFTESFKKKFPHLEHS
jgi:hypothetical protein